MDCCSAQICKRCSQDCTIADECLCCRSPLPRNDDEQFFRIEAAAKRGEAEAQSALADKRDASGDATEAARLRGLAVVQGHARAIHNLAAMHELGRGVRKDDQLAAELYSRSAELGVAESQLSYGNALRMGCGCGKDEAAAVAWFVRAASQRNAHAQYNLALMYKHGLGMASPDHGKAAQWCRCAAALGYQPAAAKLAGWLEEAKPDTEFAFPTKVLLVTTGFVAVSWGLPWLAQVVARFL